MGDTTNKATIGIKHILDLETDTVYLSDKTHHKTKRNKVSPSNKENINNSSYQTNNGNNKDNDTDSITAIRNNTLIYTDLLPSNGNGSGSSCHQCKNCKDSLYYCSNNFVNKDHSSRKVCHKKYCFRCLNKFYMETPNIETTEKWSCPACRNICCCALCVRKRDKSGQPNVPHVAINKFRNNGMNSFHASKSNIAFALPTAPIRITPEHNVGHMNALQMNAYSMQALNPQYQQYQMQIASQNFQAQQYQMQQYYQRQSIPINFDIYNPYADLVLDYTEPQYIMNTGLAGILPTNPNFQPPVYHGNNSSYVVPKQV